MSRSNNTRYSKSWDHGIKSRYLRKFPRKHQTDGSYIGMKKSNREYEYSCANVNWRYLERFLNSHLDEKFDDVKSELLSHLMTNHVSQEVIDLYKNELIPGKLNGYVMTQADVDRNAGNNVYIYRKLYVDSDGILRKINKGPQTHSARYTGTDGTTKVYREPIKSYNSKVEHNNKMVNTPGNLKGGFGPIPCGKAWVITRDGKTSIRNIVLIREDEKCSPGGIEMVKQSQLDLVWDEYEPACVIGFGETMTYRESNEIWARAYGYRFYAVKR